MVMEQLDSHHRLVVEVENNQDQDLELCKVVHQPHCSHFANYPPNFDVFDGIVVVVVMMVVVLVVVVVVVVELVAFDYDCNNLLNDVIYSSLDPKEHQHIHDAEQTNQEQYDFSIKNNGIQYLSYSIHICGYTNCL
jgi:hypothetical protein